MLARAVGIIANGTRHLDRTEFFIWVDLMTISHRQETTGNLFGEVRMVAVRLEQSEWTLIRHELRKFGLVVRCRHLRKSAELLKTKNTY